MNINEPIEMNVIFVDHIPTKQKSDIHQGGQVRRYYAWTTLNKMVENVIPFRRDNGDINWYAIRCLFKKDTKVWVEYGCGTLAHIFTLLASFIGPGRITLNIHDLAVHQRRDFDKNPPFLKRIRLNFVEGLLIHRAHTIILAWPKMLDYITPGSGQKLLIMVPGVGEDELCAHASNKNSNGRKIALYFGGMKRKGMIPWISELFSDLHDWELHLVGLKEDEDIVKRDNVKYTGSVSHNELFGIICNADIVLIPNPKNDYMDRFIPMKAAYTLLSCRPVIATRLSGLHEYISKLGLEGNVIYLDEWNRDSLKEALKKAENVKIDFEKTIEKLRQLSWEPRFNKAIGIIFDESRGLDNQIVWI